jgi:hypothetical protein
MRSLTLELSLRDEMLTYERRLIGLALADASSEITQDSEALGVSYQTPRWKLGDDQGAIDNHTKTPARRRRESINIK